MSRHPLDYLPPELWEVVSTYLKPEDLYHLSEACRFWNELLLDRKLLPIAWFPLSNGAISKFALVGAVTSSQRLYLYSSQTSYITLDEKWPFMHLAQKYFWGDLEAPTRLVWARIASCRKYVIWYQCASKNVYIARAAHEAENEYWTDPPVVTTGVIPGRLHEGDVVAYVSYGGNEFAKTDYEILVVPPEPDTLTWVQTEGRDIPEHAFVAGTDPNGDPYYISRITHDGILTVGKVHERHGLGYIAYGGKEHEYPKYEILVLTELGRTLK